MTVPTVALNNGVSIPQNRVRRLPGAPEDTSSPGTSRSAIVIPKSATPEPIAENFAATEVKLGNDEVDAISALNRDERTGPDPSRFAGRLSVSRTASRRSSSRSPSS